MKTTRKLLLAAAALGTVAVAGCASDPYHDNYAYYDRYTYTQPGYTYYNSPRYYSYTPGYYYYGPRYYSYGSRDPFYRGHPGSG